MLRQFTFLCACGSRGQGCVYARLGLVCFTDTFDMNLFRLPQLAAVIALSDGAALLLDLIQGAVNMFAVRRAVALDAGFAEKGEQSVRPLPTIEGG